MLLFRENPSSTPDYMDLKDKLTQPPFHGHTGGSFFDSSEKIIRQNLSSRKTLDIS